MLRFGGLWRAYRAIAAEPSRHATQVPPSPEGSVDAPVDSEPDVADATLGGCIATEPTESLLHMEGAFLGEIVADEKATVYFLITIDGAVCGDAPKAGGATLWVGAVQQSPSPLLAAFVLDGQYAYYESLSASSPSFGVHPELEAPR